MARKWSPLHPALYLPLGLLLLLLGAAPILAQLPEPSQVIGFELGTDYKLAHWPQILTYFDQLAQASDRVEVITLGESTMGNRFIMAVISSPQNLRQIDQIKAIQQRLADPRLTSDTEVDQLVQQGKSVILIGCNIHSTEVASTQMAMALAYHLASGQDDQVTEILNQTVLLLIPSLNPDGFQMVVDWYETYLGTPYEGGPMPWLYHKYAGHDNNRDWYMVTQQETALVTQILYHEWFPQIVYDVHQMGNSGARFFVPPFYDPVNPNIDPLLVREIMMIGGHIALDLTAQGLTGVITDAIYDTWWHGGNRSVPYRHNMIGILTEAASVNIASPIFQRSNDLTGHRRGLPRYQPQTNFPAPWPGGWWRLSDIIQYEKAAALSLLRVGVRHRETLLRNFYRLGKRAITLGQTEPPYAYLFPPDQNDPGNMAQLLETLQMGGVVIHRAEASFEADGLSYPRGTYVVLMAQPYRAHIKDLLENQTYPDRRLYPGGPSEPPYDITGWTLPLQMGVHRVAVVQPFVAKLKQTEVIEIPAGQLVGGSGRYGYILPNRTNKDAMALNRLGAEHYPLYWLQESFTAGGRTFAPGAVVIPASSGLRQNLQAITNALSVQVYAADHTPVGKTLRLLRPPRLGLYQPWTAAMDEGWTRWVLDQHDFSYTLVHNETIRAGRLRDQLDALVLPDMLPSQILNGRSATMVPPQYAGGVGREGVFQLRAFVEEGGTLIALNRSSEFVIEQLELPVTNVVAATDAGDFSCPGSLLNTLVDTDHPLATGYARQLPIFFSRGPVFETKKDTAVPLQTVLTYPGINPLLSGWLQGAPHLYGKGALVTASVGQGQVVLFGFKPQHRGQSYGTFRLLFNAIFLSTGRSETLR